VGQDLGGSDIGFRKAVSRLDAAGLLMKVEDRVDWDLELSGLLACRPEQAMFFQRIVDYDFRALGNFLSSERNILTAFGTDLRGLRERVDRGLANPLAPVRVEGGAVQEVFHERPDLGKLLPLLRYAPQDGGRYITGGIVIAKEPESGTYNASYHRLMHAGGNRLLIRLDLGRHLRTLWERAKAVGEALPVAVVMGPDLGLVYAAAIMGAQLPFEMDEYRVASGMSGAPLEVVQGQRVPLLVPAECELVMEGSISPEETMEEGPFMEFVWLYSEVAPAPVVNIECLYHRRDPLWHVITARESPVLTKPVREGVILKAVRAAAPCVVDLVLTPGGLYRFHLVMSVRKAGTSDEGWQRNAAYAAITALKDLDLIILVDDDIDIRDCTDVEWAIATRWDASRGLILLPDSRGHEYIPMSRDGVRTKAIIDATLPVGFAKRHKRVPLPRADLGRYRTSLSPGLDL
jgi:2,5-furandicarboxylate decarboxylase 1